MLLGPLGLQSQLVGHLKGLAEGQDDLVGQVLWWRGSKDGWGGVRSGSAFWASPGPENNTDVHHHVKENSRVLMEPDKRDHLSVCSFSDEGGCV